MLPLLLASSLSASPSAARLADKRLNVLMIAVDDLRPDLGCYGADYISSPNIDRLAAASLLLRQAHVQQAVCSPTRTSLLTSRRPDTTRVYDLKHHFRDMANNFTTLPEYFKRRGYASVGLGKIWHPVVCKLTGQIDDIPARGVDGSWTMAADKGGQPYYHGAFEKYWQNGGPSPNSTGGPCAKPRGCPSHLGVTAADEAARPLPDTQAVQRGAAALAALAQRDNPFFLAVGIHKPHLPFIVPEAFLSAYPNASVPLASTPTAPAGMPEVAWSPFGEIRAQYYDVHALNLSGAVNASRGMPDGLARALRRHYYAAVSYTDALVGSLLDALDATGTANHTVVALWGDHGERSAERERDDAPSSPLRHWLTPPLSHRTVPLPPRQAGSWASTASGASRRTSRSRRTA
jgi:iduronate 2-sulfatase